MRRKHDKLLLIPFLGVILGMSIPIFLFGVNLDGPKSGLAGGAFTATSLLIIVLFIKAGEKYPELGNWANSTITGNTLTIFSACFICSSITALFLLVPIPIWLGYSLVTFYMLFSIYYLLKGNRRENDL